PHGRGVPARRDAGPPAARRPGSPAAHLPARPGQRRAGRPADRPPWLGTDPAESRRCERVRRVPGPRADLVPLPPPVRRSAPAGAAPHAARGLPAPRRRAAGWFTQHGQVAEAIRHTQAAGDWPEAALLLADHSFSLTLDGQAQTIQALLRAFPPGADHPELALVRAMGDLAQGRLDEAAAHLAV